MASIARAALAAYRRSLDGVCSGAGTAATRALGEWLAAHPDASVEECREAATAVAQAVLEPYGDASSSLACDLFDSVMEAEGVAVPSARMYGGVREDAIEGTVRRVVGDLDGSQASLDLFASRVGQLAERETRLAANTTVEENVERVAKTKAGRDVRYARVPTRAVPCEWCAMLASRGFVYRSAERAEAASHRHCTCTIVPGIKGVTQVEGYDPEHYADVWQHREKYEGAVIAEEATTLSPGSYYSSSLTDRATGYSGSHVEQYEESAVYDRDGNMIGEVTQGTENSVLHVKPDGYEWGDLRIAHTHPSGVTFSTRYVDNEGNVTGDIFVFCDSGVISTDVITDEYVFALERTADFKPDDFLQAATDAESDAQELALGEFIDSFFAEQGRPPLTEAELESGGKERLHRVSDLMDAWYNEKQQEYGYVYTKRRRG